jgi:hypothetical protein
LTTTLVSCPTTLAVFPETARQITTPSNCCKMPVAVVRVMVYCPFAANGVGELLVLSAVNEYSSLAMGVKKPVPSVRLT